VLRIELNQFSVGQLEFGYKVQDCEKLECNGVSMKFGESRCESNGSIRLIGISESQGKEKKQKLGALKNR